jgi:hypothetical protein
MPLVISGSMSGLSARLRRHTRSRSKRQAHPKAYSPWLPEDGESLMARYADGASVAELAVEFEQGEGAIRSRLLRLGQLSQGVSYDAETPAAHPEARP